MTRPDDARTERSWAVIRQDDHGNRFVVETGLTRDEAERMARRYELKRHHQSYWAVPSEQAAGLP